MFAGSEISNAGAWIAAGVSITVAIISAGVSLYSNWKSNRNARDIQDVQTGVNRDLERFKKQLEHGQLVRSAQWNVEFDAYQAIWKTLVPVRHGASDLATFEQAIARFGLLDDMPAKAKLDQIMDRAKVLDAALMEFSNSIQNNAPFYPAHIRTNCVAILNPLREFASEMVVFVFAHLRDEVWGEQQMLSWRVAREKSFRLHLLRLRMSMLPSENALRRSA